jgi:hypothetical protein
MTAYFKLFNRPIPHDNHRACVTEMIDAIEDVAARYADKVRKTTDGRLEALNACDWDERPGGLPAKYDCKQMRDAMKRHIREAYRVR